MARVNGIDVSAPTSPKTPRLQGRDCSAAPTRPGVSAASSAAITTRICPNRRQAPRDARLSSREEAATFSSLVALPGGADPANRTTGARINVERRTLCLPWLGVATTMRWAFPICSGATRYYTPRGVVASARRPEWASARVGDRCRRRSESIMELWQVRPCSRKSRVAALPLAGAPRSKSCSEVEVVLWLVRNGPCASA